MPLLATEQTQFTQLVLIEDTDHEVQQMVTTYEKAGIEKGKLEG